jgi:hypothetical protein
MHMLEMIVQCELEDKYIISNDTKQRSAFQFSPRVKKLQWVSSAGLQGAVHHALTSFSKLANDSNLFVFVFEGYGKHFIKKTCNAMSNSWIQMAFQLAHYRHCRRFVLTYESCELRYFAQVSIFNF